MNCLLKIIDTMSLSAAVLGPGFTFFFFLMIISGTTLWPSPWLPWQPHQCAILADCQSVGIDYSDIIPQHLAQSAEFLWHEIAPFHLRASDLNGGRQQARRESEAATLQSGFSKKTSGEVKRRFFLKGSHYQTCSGVRFPSPLTLPVITHLGFGRNV